MTEKFTFTRNTLPNCALGYYLETIQDDYSNGCPKHRGLGRPSIPRLQRLEKQALLSPQFLWQSIIPVDLRVFESYD